MEVAGFFYRNEAALVGTCFVQVKICAIIEIEDIRRDGFVTLFVASLKPFSFMSRGEKPVNENIEQRTLLGNLSAEAPSIRHALPRRRN